MLLPRAILTWVACIVTWGYGDVQTLTAVEGSVWVHGPTAALSVVYTEAWSRVDALGPCSLHDTLMWVACTASWGQPDVHGSVCLWGLCLSQWSVLLPENMWKPTTCVPANCKEQWNYICKDINDCRHRRDRCGRLLWPPLPPPQPPTKGNSLNRKQFKRTLMKHDMDVKAGSPHWRIQVGVWEGNDSVLLKGQATQSLTVLQWVYG